MIHSIRFRIALAVFAAILALLGIQLWVVLGRVERALRSQVDHHLEEEVRELSALLGTPQLQPHLDVESRRTKWDELLIEVLDAQGRLVASTPVRPPAPAPGVSRPEPGEFRLTDQIHPASRTKHRRMRIAEVEANGHWLRLGASLKLAQKRYWALRETLAYALAVIAIVGAGVAWGAATWMLRPVQRIAERARELGALREGELPRTHSGDEIDQLAAVLNDLLNRLRAEVARIMRLTADAGHALRTPLTAIRGHLELELARVPDAHSEGLAAILEDFDRLIRIVNQLLLLEKLESTAPAESATERFDIAELVHQLVDDLSVLADERGVALHCKSEPVPVRANPGQIRQALTNLIDNALRHTPRGAGVSVEVSSGESSVRIGVQDGGSGLAPQELQRVFERFYSGLGENGTGLGLPIARAIARAHGGDVTASSPRGALFVLELPRATDQPS